jgi:hypothetical protein
VCTKSWIMKSAPRKIEWSLKKQILVSKSFHDISSIAFAFVWSISDTNRTRGGQREANLNFPILISGCSSLNIWKTSISIISGILFLTFSYSNCSSQLYWKYECKKEKMETSGKNLQLTTTVTYSSATLSPLHILCCKQMWTKIILLMTGNNPPLNSMM